MTVAADPADAPKQDITPQRSDDGDTSHQRTDRVILARVDWLIALAAGALTVLALSPVVTTTYGFIDDYSALYAMQTDPGSALEGALLEGRPVAALLDAAFFSVVHTVGRLAIMRAFSIACLALLAMLVFVALRRVGYNRLAAWLFAAGLLWLPSTQVMASWAILLIAPFALVLAVLAAMSFGTGIDRTRQQGGGRGKMVLRFLPSVALLSVSVCAYQPAAMVFWPLVFLLLLAPTRRGWSLRALLRGTLGAGAIGATSALVGYAAIVVGQAVVNIPYARTSLVSNVGGKISYLEKSAFPRVFDPWQLWPNQTLAGLVFLALVLLVPLSVRGGVSRSIFALLLFLAALLLSYLPSELTAENWASARSLVAAFVVPLAALAVVVQGLPFTGRLREVTGVAAGVAVAFFAFYSGHKNVSDYFVTPGHEELMLARAEVRPSLDTRAPVAVIRSDYTDTLAPGFSYDEFGIPSTYAAWVPVPFTQLLAREVTGRWLPEVTLVEQADVSSLPATTIVVNYGHLLDPRDNPVVYRGSAKAGNK